MNPLHEIRACLRAVPFRPFIIRVTDGREFPVPHPDFLTVTPRGTILFEHGDDSAYISPLHVVSVDKPAQSASA